MSESRFLSVRYSQVRRLASRLRNPKTAQHEPLELQVDRQLPVRQLLRRHHRRLKQYFSSQDRPVIFVGKAERVLPSQR